MAESRQGRRRFLAGLTLLSLPLLGPARALAQEEDLPAALGRITAAFSAGDTERLAPLLPARGKIHLALPALGIEAGYYSAAQCRYLLADAFRRHPVRSFHLEPPAEPAAAPQVTVRGQLVAAPPGQERRPILLHFLLSREDEGWVLREIRQQPRP